MHLAVRTEFLECFAAAAAEFVSVTDTAPSAAAAAITATTSALDNAQQALEHFCKEYCAAQDRPRSLPPLHAAEVRIEPEGEA
jgi:hypothetical protein